MNFVFIILLSLISFAQADNHGNSNILHVTEFDSEYVEMLDVISNHIEQSDLVMLTWAANADFLDKESCHNEVSKAMAEMATNFIERVFNSSQHTAELSDMDYSNFFSSVGHDYSKKHYEFVISERGNVNSMKTCVQFKKILTDIATDIMAMMQIVNADSIIIYNLKKNPNAKQLSWMVAKKDQVTRVFELLGDIYSRFVKYNLNDLKMKFNDRIQNMRNQITMRDDNVPENFVIHDFNNIYGTGNKEGIVNPNMIHSTHNKKDCSLADIKLNQGSWNYSEITIDHYSLESNPDQKLYYYKTSERRIIRGDGNCLYRSIAEAIGLGEECHEIIRRLALDTLKKMVIDEKSKSIIARNEIENYIKEQSQLGSYGDWYSIYALSRALDVCITIYMIGSEGKKYVANILPDDYFEGLPTINLILHGEHYDLLVHKK